MRMIATGAEKLVTHADIADAVLDYAGVLARARGADTVTIPIVAVDGEPGVARLLLGPASQIAVLPDDTAEIELPGADASLKRIRQKIRDLEPGPVTEGAEAGAVGDAGAYFVSFDEFK